MKIFDPKNWYWYVAGDQTKVYSSSAGDYVALNDPAFIAWSSDGSTPTSIDTEASLGDVLAPHQLRPVPAAVLDSYKGSQSTTILSHVGFKILFNHENRLRAIERALNLNGSPANITAQQAFNVVKGLM